MTEPAKAAEPMAAEAPPQASVWRTASSRLALMGFAVLLLLVALVGYAVFKESQASSDARQWVDHTYEVIDNIRRVFDDAQDAETGERGFIITGDPVYLAPYDTALFNVDGDHARLRALIADNQGQLARLAVLDSLMEKESTLLRQEVTGRRAAGQTAPADMAAEEGERLLMDDIRRVVEEMISAERLLLIARDTDRERSARANLTIVIAALIAAALAMGLAIFMGAGYLQRRREDQAALAAQTALLTATIESISQAIGVYDTEHRLLVWNGRYTEWSGLDKDQFVPGVSLATLLARAAEAGDFGDDPDKIKTWIAERTRVFAARVPYESERVRPDGTVLQIRGTFTDEGLAVTTFSDITAAKRAEQALQSSVARLNAIFDNALDGIITINESGSIESFNPAAEHVFGYTAHELRGRNIKMLMPEPYRGHHDGYLRNYRLTGEKKVIGTRRELEGMRKDGTVFPIELSISEFWSDGRRLFVGIARDISERKQVERIKNEFVSAVSHELRTPLTSIAGSLGLLAGSVAGELPERAKRLVEIANNNSWRLVRLVNDILDLDKIESGRMKFTFSPQPLLPLVEASLEANRGYAVEHKVRFELDPAAKNGMVLADTDRIAQVLANLLSNAAKFSPAGERVAIEIIERGNHLRVTVRDRGPGIPDEFRATIFQKFAQADGKDNRRKGGTGLGLNIARSIVEKHGGALTFDSVAGQGAAFHVDLPIWEEGIDGYTAADGTSRAPSPSVESAPGAAALQVLHIEDDEDVRRVVGFALEGIAEIVPARSMAEARQLLQAAHFDLAILDIALPDGNGLGLLPMPAARSGDPLPVVIFSSQEIDVDPGPQIRAVLTKSKASAAELRRWVVDIARGAPARPTREASV